MPEHTVKAYSEELEALSSEVARMGGIAESAFSDSLAAVVRRDTRLAREVVARDEKIDEAQREIEHRAIRLMALRHPYANDLRQVLSAWRIGIDLERVGDLAKNIAKRTKVINEFDPIDLTQSIESMGKFASIQLKAVLDAYSSRDAKAAVGVWSHDEDIDRHYNALFRELLTYMMEDPRTIGPCAHLLFVAKNIERIGDHCTNIAEQVHYLVTGEELIRDRPKRGDVAAAPPAGEP
ncbi:MAG: phosphate signaling complex protein PhoU [Hyphomonadaceae bacterium]|nr:phosphate signaling complex protein PhoU [Hyphomonadaceae bacterium]